MEILKPAMLEHILHRISITWSRIRKWVPQLTKVPIVQSLASRVQRSKLLSSVQELRYALNIYTVSFSLISLELKADCIARNNYNVIRTSLYLLPFININDCFSEHHLLETYGEQSGFLLSVPFIIPPDLVSTHQHNVPFNKHCFTMKVPSTSLHSGR